MKDLEDELDGPTTRVQERCIFPFLVASFTSWFLKEEVIQVAYESMKRAAHG